MKKLLILSLIAFSAVLSSCNEYEDIKLIDIKNVEVKEINMKGVALHFTSVLDNPNNMKFTVADTDLKLYVNEMDMGNVSLDEPIHIAKKAQREYRIKLRCKFENMSLGIIPAVISAFSGSSANVKIKGYVKARKFLLTKKFPIEITDKIKF